MPDEPSNLALIMEVCNQPDFRIERNFDPASDEFGWWWVGFRNAPAFKAPHLLLAIERFRRNNHRWTP